MSSSQANAKAPAKSTMMKSGKTYAEELTEVKNKEPHATKAVRKLTFHEYLEVCVYWASRIEPKNRHLKPQEQDIKIQENQRMSQRVTDIVQNFGSRIQTTPNEWTEDVKESGIMNTTKYSTPRVLRMALHNKKNSANYYLTTTNSGNPLQAPVDKKNEQGEGNQAFPEEEYSDSDDLSSKEEQPFSDFKVIDMEPGQLFEAMKYFLNQDEVTGTSSKNTQKVKDRTLELVAVEWARMASLRYELLVLKDKEQPPPAHKWNDDGLAGFKKDMKRKDSTLCISLKKAYDEASVGTRKLPWEMELRDPEFKRILKKKYEIENRKGRPCDPEPHASKKASSMSPREVKDALVWFVDREDDNINPTYLAWLADWKRVVALHVRVLEIRNAKKDKELKDPSDELHDDIAEEAERKITVLAKKYKDSFFKFTNNTKTTIEQMDSEEKDEVRNMGREGSNKAIFDAFYKSMEVHFASDQVKLLFKGQT